MGKTMANREVADIILYDYATGKPFLNIDYANMTTNEHTATSVYAKGGKGAPNRIRSVSYTHLRIWLRKRVQFCLVLYHGHLKTPSLPPIQ